MKKILFQFAGTAALCLAGAFFGMADVSAAVLTNNELIPEGYSEITGEGFGSLSSGSFLCFNINTKCFGKDTFTATKGFEWSDSKIVFGIPGDIPISGSVIVYNSGKRSVCSGSTCTIQDVITEHARLSYLVKPLLKSVLPLVWERDATVMIKGAGFGDAVGSVLFDDLTASVVRWTDKELAVRAPQGGATKRITVQSANNTRVAFDIFSYLDQIQVPKAWSLAGDSPVTVAVIDDGVYVNHPVIKSAIWKNSKEIPGNKKDDDANGYVDDVYGYNFITDTASVDPNGSHGTRVASIILSTAQSGMTGTKSHIRIMPLVVADANGVISSREGVTKAIRYAADNGARIINTSFGSGGTIGYSKEYDNAIQYAFDRGAIVVAAAGNDDRLSKDGTDLNVVPQSPVCNSNGRFLLLGVAALDNIDIPSEGKKRARWSSYGSNCIQLSAPGTSIPGAIPPQYSADKNTYYDRASGTSFATPVVSGVAAMMMATFPTVPHWEIMNRIIASVDNVDEQNRDVNQGIGGRINAYRAMQSLSLQPSWGLVESSVAEPGGALIVRLAHFSSQFQLKLVSSRSSTPLQSSALKALAADTFELRLPHDMEEGIYRVAVFMPASFTTILSESSFEVRRRALPTLLVDKLQSDTDAVVQPPSVSAVSFVDQERLLSRTSDPKITQRLRGRILLQVELAGQAWYVNPTDGKRYYMKDGVVAFEMLRSFGLGIRSSDLSLIPREGTTSATISRLAERMKGRILIDVEHHGEAWYVNPTDGKRYYLKNGNEAYRIMRQLALGITNASLRAIPIGR